MHSATTLQPAAPRTNWATWTGLALSLFSMLAIRQVFRAFTAPDDPRALILREALYWVSALVLFALIRAEGLGLRSIGLGTARWWKSALWGLLLTPACFAVALPIAHLTQYGHGQAASIFEKLPLWLVTLIVVRAGVIEELFYRGFAIERLQSLGTGKAMSVVIPLAIFGVGHWTGGGGNILIALAVGAILSLFYLWRRDLVACIVAHFLVDFIGNVVPRLFA